MLNVIFRFKMLIRYLANPKIDVYFRCTRSIDVVFTNLKRNFCQKTIFICTSQHITIFDFKYLITKKHANWLQKKTDPCVITER